MIFILTIIALANIAIGYGLAVYLSHGKWPWQIPLAAKRAFTLRTPVVASAEADEEQKVENEANSIESPEQKRAATQQPLVAEAVEEPEKTTGEAAPQDEGKQTIDLEPTAQLAEEDADPMAVDLESLSQKLTGEFVQAEPEQPEEPSLESASEPSGKLELDSEQEALAEANSSAEVQDSQDSATAEQPTATTQPEEEATIRQETEEKLLESLDDFQKQLLEQREKTKLAAVYRVSEEDGQEYESDKQQVAGDTAVLAGIEAFREQLASLTSEKSD